MSRRSNERIEQLERTIASLEARLAALEAQLPPEGSAAVPSNDQLASTLAELVKGVERVEGMLATSDPEAPRTADAFQGLRKAVITASGNSMAHRVDLARIDAAARRRSSVEELAPLLDEMLGAAGIERVEQLDDLTLFEVVGDEADGGLVLNEPAHVVVVDGTAVPVRMGRAAYSGVEHDEVSETDPDGHVDPPEGEEPAPTDETQNNDEPAEPAGTEQETDDK